MLPTTTFAYFGTNPTEWLIIGAIVLVLFGGAKIPQLAKGLGEGIREFKKSVAPDAESDVKIADSTDKEK
jgi:sec-independent protein translocase protein TatA